MYGTVAKMKAKPGTGELLAELGRQLHEDKPAGMVGTWVYQMDADPDEYILAVAFESRSNVVDVYVRYLREKIDRPFERHSLETVRGVGYRLRAD